MAAPEETRYWDTRFLSPCEGEQPNPAALIVLNQYFAPATLSRLWLKCESVLPMLLASDRKPLGQWRIFADGGSNRVYDAFSEKDRLR